MNFKRYEGKIAGSYDLEETIGKGHFAVVKLARHVYSGEKVAVKVIDKTKLDDVSKSHLFQEVGCMKLVQHPNVVRLYEVIDTPHKLYLIMELGDGGDMYDFISQHVHGLDEEMARRYFRQVVHAINYCHQLHVVHRDLKLENIVIFKKLGIVKLTDFGFSNRFIPGRNLETSCGSLAYSAPEILLGDSYDAPAVDVWSLGVILYMLVVGDLPFQEANDSETLTKIMDCNYKTPAQTSAECQNLISLMLIRDPALRISLPDMLNHVWVTRGEPSPLPLLPLVSWEHLTQDEHGLIISKMVARKMATKDDILQALERNAYNHITATYYLLAESRLRKQREKHGHGKHAHGKTALSPIPAAGQQKHTKTAPKSKLAPLALSPRTQLDATSEKTEQSSPSVPVAAPPRRTRSPVERGFLLRKCSLIQEEVLEEGEEDMEVDENQAKENVRDIKRQNYIEESLSDDSDTRSTSGGKDKCSPARSAPARRQMPVRPLHSVKSSPQLLNQIFEEGESEDEDILPSLKQKISLALQPSPEILRKFESQRKRLGKGQRGTSCSSSDTSDTDDPDSRRRRDKMKGRIHRRDSSDHSSDTDGPSGPSGFGGGGGGRLFGATGGANTNRGRDNKSNKNDKKSNKTSNNKSGTSRQNGNTPGSQQVSGTLLGKRDSSSDRDNSQSEVGCKMSNVSIASNMSNLSITSGGSGRSGKYVVESTDGKSETDSLTPCNKSQPSSKDMEAALNEENKAKSRIIHVRSKDFSSLMERFSASKHLDIAEPGTAFLPQQQKPHDVSGIKFRKRPKEKMKTDINRNGLIARADCSLAEEEQEEELMNTAECPQHPNVVKTKCCSVV